MSDPLPTNPSPAPARNEAADRKPKRRWLKRIVIGLVVFVVFLVVLVALAPTIASTAFVRSIIEKQATGYLEGGSIKIASTSFSWTGKQQIGGIKLYAADGSLVAEVDQLSTDLPLTKAIRGNIDLGDTVVDVNLTRLQVDSEGRTNLAQMIKPTEPTPDEPAGELPDVRGKIRVKFRGTIEYVDRIGPGAKLLSPPVHIDSGEANIDIADLNSGVDNAIKLALRLGDAPAGSINIAGKIDAIENRQVNLDKLVADQRVELVNINFAALQPILRLAKLDGALGGVMNGSLALKADGLTQARVDGQLAIADFSASGFPELRGDTFRTASVNVPIKVTRNVIDNGRTTLLKVESLRIDTPEAFVAIAAELDETSVTNVVHGRAPGADGWLQATIAVRDLTVANNMPNALRLQPGVRITGGQLSQTVDLALRKDKSFMKTRLDVEVAATGQDGRPVRVEPIGASIDATYEPAARPLEGLADIAVLVTSPFATAKGGGKKLDQLDLTGNLDFGKLQQQLAQVVDFGGVQLQGAVDFALGSKGDLQQPDSDVAASAKFNLRGVNLQLPNQPQIVIDAMDVTADAVMRTASGGGVARVSSAKVVANSLGNAGDKVLEFAATATNYDFATGSVERFDVSNISISSLATMQRQFGAFLPALREHNIQISDGQLYANVGGSYDGPSSTLVLDKPFQLSTPNLTVTSGGARLLDREKITVRVGGRFVLAPAGTTADLNDVAVQSSILNVTKSDAPFQIRLDQSGAITGAGRLDVTADLARLSAMTRALGSTATTADGKVNPAPPPADVRSGQFAAAIDLQGGVGQASTLVVDGNITGLTVATAAGATALQDEKIELRLQAVVPADLASLAADGRIKSGFVEASLTGAKLNLPTAAKQVGVFEMVDSAKVEANVRDLPKLYAIAQAFAPSEATIIEEGAEPPQPLQITSGGASLVATMSRASGGKGLAVKVEDLRVSKLVLERGGAKYAFDRETPISFTLAANIQSAGDAIRAIEVTQLAGDARVATVSMPSPININLTGDKPAATGAVRLAGNLADMNGLLTVLQIVPEGTQLAGGLQFEAKASTQGNVVTAKLDGKIDQFQLRSADQQPLPPRQVVIDGLVKLDSAAEVLSVDHFMLKLPENDALAIDLRGGTVSLKDLLVKLDGTTINYSYDLAYLFPLVLPLLDPETQVSLADTQIKGKLSRTMKLSGAYAAEKPFNEAIAGVSGEGAFDVELLNSQGLTINSLSIPFAMTNGVVKITATNPATANNGTLNLNGIVADLTTPEPRISGPKKQRILQRVSINPALGNTLGKYINPAFPNSDRAQGLLDVTIDRLDRVALGEAMFSEDSGTARIVFSITDMDIANPLGPLMFGKIAGALNMSSSETQTFRGEIRDAVITLEKGRTTQQVTMQLAEDVEATDPVSGKTIRVPRNMPLTFEGNIRLSDLAQKLKVTLPSPLVAKLIPGVREKDMLEWFPSGVTLALGGTTTAPQVDLGDFASEFLQAQIRSRVGGAIRGGDGKGSGNPLDDLIRGIGGGKDKDKDREKDRDKPPPR